MHTKSQSVHYFFTALALFTTLGLAQADNGTGNGVDCNKGDTLARALEKAKPGETITATGICNETVSVATNGVTIDGGGTAILDGGGKTVVTLDNVHNVTLTGFTVRNGAVGIRIAGGADVAIRQTTVTNCRSQGIAVNHALAEISDTTLLNNNVSGLQLTESATVHFTGTVSSHHNTGWGIVVLGNSSLSSFFGVPSTLSTYNNSRDGVAVIGGSQMSLLAAGQVFDSHENTSSGLLLATNASLVALFGSKVDAQRNGVNGISIFSSSALNASDGATISAKMNGQDGILIAQNSAFGVTNFIGLVPLPLKVETTNNGKHGIEVSAGGSLAVDRSTLTSSTNTQAGLAVDDGSTVTLVGSQQTPVTLAQNSVQDIILSFGSRATLVGIVNGTIACDPTVLIRGTVSCEP